MKPLTTEEVTRVELRTAREGSSHRRWPPDVIRTFAAVDIIRMRAEPGSRSGARPLHATFRSFLSRALHALSPGSARAGM